MVCMYVLREGRLVKRMSGEFLLFAPICIGKQSEQYKNGPCNFNDLFLRVHANYSSYISINWETEHVENGRLRCDKSQCIPPGILCE